MWPAVRAELRAPRTQVRIGLAAAVVGVVALAAMPINGAVSGVYDPQAGDEQFYDWYDRALWRFSSGFLIGQLVSLALGAALALDGRVRSGRMLAVKAFAAGGAGALLAVVNAAVAIPVAAATIEPPLELAREFAGWPLGTHTQNVLTDPAALLALAVLLGAFPLYALVGVGLGVLVPWRWVLVAVVLLWWVGGFLVGVPFFEYPVTAPVFWGYLLLPQVAGLASITLTTIRVHPEQADNLPPGYAHVGLLLGILGYAALLNAAAWLKVRRRGIRVGRGGT